jgi:MFS family permease
MTQTDLSTVSGIGDFGGSIAGVPMGIFYDIYGPKKTYLISAFFLFGGYFLIYLSLKKLVFSFPVALGIYLFIGGFGSSSAYYPSMGTNLKNFSKKHHGKVAGVLIGMYGISAAIVTMAYRLFFKGKENGLEGYFLFLSVYLSILPFLGIAGVMKNPYKKKEDGKSESKYYGDISGFQMLKTADYYLIFFIHFVLSGVGLTFINTVASISVSYSATIDKTIFVTLLSVSNFAGRIIFGFTMDLLRDVASEVFWYNIIAVFMAANSIMLGIFSDQIFLLIGTVAFGMAYGGLNAITAVCMNLYFGSVNFGKNSGPVYLGTALSGFFLGIIVGGLYDSQADLSHKCYGVQCFRVSFFLEAGLAALISIASIILTIRSRQFRKRVEYVKIN